MNTTEVKNIKPAKLTALTVRMTKETAEAILAAIEKYVVACSHAFKTCNDIIEERLTNDEKAADSIIVVSDTAHDLLLSRDEKSPVQLPEYVFDGIMLALGAAANASTITYGNDMLYSYKQYVYGSNNIEIFCCTDQHEFTPDKFMNLVTYTDCEESKADES